MFCWGIWELLQSSLIAYGIFILFRIELLVKEIHSFFGASIITCNIPKKIADFLKLTKDDIARATGIPKASIRYDDRIPAECTVSLEVAEHLEPTAAPWFCQNLTELSTEWIVLSAAPPGQAGTHHVNCQPFEYWQNLLPGFTLHDDMTKRLQKAWQLVKNARPWYLKNVRVLRKTP